MTSERAAWETLHPLDARPTHRPATCACGQELDTCSGHHCPRCGTSTGRRAA